MAKTSLFVIADDVHSRVENGKLFLLKEGESHLFELNETSRFLWEKLNKPISQENLELALFTEFNGMRKEIEKDVVNFLSEFTKEGLIDQIDSSV